MTMDKPSEPEWLALEKRLRHIVEPLLEAGWRVEGAAIRDRGDVTYAPSAAYDLRRGNDVVEIEYLASGRLNLFTDVVPAASDEDEPTPAITIDLSDSDTKQFFRENGLLS